MMVMLLRCIKRRVLKQPRRMHDLYPRPQIMQLQLKCTSLVRMRKVGGGGFKIRWRAGMRDLRPLCTKLNAAWLE